MHYDDWCDGSLTSIMYILGETGGDEAVDFHTSLGASIDSGCDLDEWQIMA